jgi:hypothetical protein
MATDMITVQGLKVGFMYRQEPTERYDSGWTFTAGVESQYYMDVVSNHAIYDVNTIANYDPDIIPFLEEPVGSAYERDRSTGLFFPVDFEPPD